MNAPQLQFLMLIFAGWVNRHQQDVIEYLQDRYVQEHSVVEALQLQRPGIAS